MTAIHQHFNLRKICDLDLDQKTLDALARKPTLENRQRGDKHEVAIQTTVGRLVLFSVKGNGQPYVVTPTPQVALALAANAAHVI